MRVQSTYSGRVQGVGFRFATHRIAQRHPVVGFVKNRPDGTVEVVAEGEEVGLCEFLDEVRAVMDAGIRNEHREVGVESGEFESFEIH